MGNNYTLPFKLPESQFPKNLLFYIQLSAFKSKKNTFKCLLEGSCTTASVIWHHLWTLMYIKELFLCNWLYDYKIVLILAQLENEFNCTELGYSFPNIIGELHTYIQTRNSEIM